MAKPRPWRCGNGYRNARGLDRWRFRWRTHEGGRPRRRPMDGNAETVALKPVMFERRIELLVTQGHHGIHACSPARGKVAGHQHNNSQHSRDTEKYCRIVWSDLK